MSSIPTPGGDGQKSEIGTMAGISHLQPEDELKIAAAETAERLIVAMLGTGKFATTGNWSEVSAAFQGMYEAVWGKIK